MGKLTYTTQQVQTILDNTTTIKDNLVIEGDIIQGVTIGTSLLRYNYLRECLEIVYENGQIQQIGRELTSLVYSPIDIVDGMPCYINGATTIDTGSGLINVVKIAPASNTSIATSQVDCWTTVPVTAGSLAVCATFGDLNDLNTLGNNQGSVVYLADEGWTTTPPSSPDLIVELGHIIKVGETDGIIKVHPPIFSPISTSSLQSKFFLSNTDSDIAGYKTLSKNIDLLETEKSITVSAATSPVSGESYLSEPIGCTNLPDGVLEGVGYFKVSSTVGVTKMEFRVSLYHEDGTTTLIADDYSEEINNTEYSLYRFSVPYYSVTCLPTDRILVEVVVETTSNSNLIFNYVIGDGRASHIILPLPMSHNDLINLNADSNFLHTTTSEKTYWNNKVDSNPIGANGGIITAFSNTSGDEIEAIDLRYISNSLRQNSIQDFLDISPNKLLSFGRYTTNTLFGINIHKGDNTDVVNHFLKGNGDSYLAGDNGNVAIGKTTATEKLDVDGNIAVSGTVNGRDIAADGLKLNTIEEGAEVNVNADWNSVSGDSEILNKPTDVTDLSTHSVKELNDVISAGSGSIITSIERTKLNTIEEGAEVNQTDSEIKTQYENNANTNAFTDSEKIKVANSLQSTDHVLEFGETTTPTDDTADGGGITLLGATNKTITWVKSKLAWVFNQGIVIEGDARIVGEGTFNKLRIGSSYVMDALVSNLYGGSLGQTAGDNVLHSSNAISVSNRLKQNLYAVRKTDGIGWESAILHDSISIDAAYITPGVDTRTWYERDPKLQTHAWGSGATEYAKLTASTFTTSGTVNGRDIAADGEKLDNLQIDVDNIDITDDAPNDTQVYGRKDGAWALVESAGGVVIKARSETNLYFTSMANVANTPILLSKDSESTTNPDPLPSTSPYGTFAQGEIDPYIVRAGKLTKIAIKCAFACVSQSTVGVNPVIQLELFKHTHSSRTSLGTFDIPINNGTIGTFNNLGTSSDIFGTLDVDVSLNDCDLIGIQFNPITTDNNKISGLGRVEIGTCLEVTEDVGDLIADDVDDSTSTNKFVTQNDLDKLDSITNFSGGKFENIVRNIDGTTLNEEITLFTVPADRAALLNDVYLFVSQSVDYTGAGSLTIYFTPKASGSETSSSFSAFGSSSGDAKSTISTVLLEGSTVRLKVTSAITATTSNILCKADIIY